MLLINATVQCHAGASGGAVVNAGGHTVGMTTSNARHAASGSTKPNLIFAVAVDALQPWWNLAEQPQGLTHLYLQQLVIKEPALLDIWTISKPSEESTLKLEVKVSARLAELLSKSRLVRARCHQWCQGAHKAAQCLVILPLQQFAPAAICPCSNLPLQKFAPAAIWPCSNLALQHFGPAAVCL